ncbi:hypothetical protein MRX96_036253 [Rhipicephalus microplus]
MFLYLQIPRTPSLIASNSNRRTVHHHPPFPDMPILGPLHLTPYINECEYDKAKEISQVKLFKDIANATAYSGYITVNSTTKSHIFFLFYSSRGQ